jgi:class 3 adenylate cyclase
VIDYKRQLELILEIDRISDGAMDESMLILQLAACLAEGLDADLVLFSLPDEEGAGARKLQSVIDRRNLLPELPSGELNKLISECLADFTKGEKQVLLESSKGESVYLLVVPQSLNMEVLGVVIVARKGNDFEIHEIELLRVATTRIDSALKHTRTLSELARETQALSTVLQVDRIRDTSTSLDELLDRALNALTNVIHAEAGFIMLYDRRGKRLELRAVSGRNLDDLGEGIGELYMAADQAIQSGSIVHRKDLNEELQAVMGVPLILNERIIGVLGVFNPIEERGFLTAERKLLEAIASQMDTAIFERLETQRLREVFGRRVGGKVMDRLLQISDRDLLEGERIEVTVMFSDIRGFTENCTRLSAKILEEMINMHFEAMVNVILENEGTLDKFTGDGVMAFFNAPERQPDHHVRAIRAALQMHAAHKDVLAEWQLKGYPLLPIGIGVATGEAIVGNFGSHEHAEYTLIGSTVNLAARLCSDAEDGQILVDKINYELVCDQVDAVALPARKLKGFEELIPVWNVNGLKK